MKIIPLFIFVLMTLQPAALKAQAELFIVEGKIIDASTGHPLEDAEVYLNGKMAAKSVEDGKYKLEAPKERDNLLEFRKIGYVPATRKIQKNLRKSILLNVQVTPATISLPAIVVSGESERSKIIEISRHVEEITGAELQRQAFQSIASVLRNETGLAIQSMGPAPSRPVLRGLGGDRIKLNVDGMEIIDMSSSSNDHAVAGEPYSAEKIEIIRGPQSLLNNAMPFPGVINLINKAIPMEMAVNSSLNTGLSFNSVNEEYLASLEGEVPWNKFVFKAAGLIKKNSDMNTPSGRLINTSSFATEYKAGASYINSDFAAGTAYSKYNLDYGVPGGFVGAHPKGVDISLKKHNGDVRLFIDLHHDVVDNIDVKASGGYYNHVEKESSGLTGAEYIIRNAQARVDFIQSKKDFFTSGSFGLSGLFKEYEFGGYVFTPDSKEFSGSAFAFEEFTLFGFLMQAASRFSYTGIRPSIEKSSIIGDIKSRDFFLFGASITGMKEIWKGTFAGLNLSRGTRAPSVQELFSEGPHLASYSFEIGNPELKTEEIYGAETFLNISIKESSIGMNLYWNEAPYFIAVKNTGDTNWSQQLPIYKAEGVKARIYGAELVGDLHILENLELLAGISYVKAMESESQKPLPSIPPVKANIELKYLISSFTLGSILEAAAAQNEVSDFEQPTDAYAILNLYAQYSFVLAGSANILSFAVENLFDTEYRNHLSRVKSIMPEPGRNFRLNIRSYL